MAGTVGLAAITVSLAMAPAFAAGRQSVAACRHPLLTTRQIAVALGVKSVGGPTHGLGAYECDYDLGGRGLAISVIRSTYSRYVSVMTDAHAAEPSIGKYGKLPGRYGKHGVSWREPSTGLIVVNTWSKGRRITVAGNGFSVQDAEKLIALLLSRL
jgi:hypothetical protein